VVDSCKQYSISKKQTFICFACKVSLSLIFIMSLLGASFSQAASGVEWLVTQTQADGSFGNVGGVATSYQATAEVLRTFNQLGENSQPDIPAAVQYIDSDTYQSSEYLSRRIIVNAQQGNDVAVLLAQLQTYQNINGGFGELPDYDVTVIDTVFALQALVAAGDKAGDSAWYAINFLLDEQNADAGWSDGENTSRTYTTALAIQALLPFRTVYPDVWNVTNAAQTFLIGQQDVDSLWGEVFISAIVLQALISNTSDSSAFSESINALQTLQDVDGSWAGDVYQTALALQVLALAANPPPAPNLANITGRVIDAETGLSLSGVTVDLASASTVSGITSVDGSFSFNNVAQGDYSLSISYPDYAVIAMTFTALPGQTADIGTILLTRASAATTGIVRGVITDADTGLPLDGVTVTVTGVAEPAITDSNGAYQISNVPPSEVTLQANKEDYSIGSATATITAGGVVIFSPALSITAHPLLNQIKGTIVDGVTGLPLQGALISVSGATMATANTDAQGNYSISSLNAEQTTIVVSLAGYDTVTVVANIFGGSIINFSPQLFLTGTTPSGANTMGVTGIAMDSVTNAVLAGVTVQATFGGSIVTLTTDVNGRFDLNGLTDLYGNLVFNLPDYTSVNFDVTLALLSVLDIGQVRMRPVQILELIPDLIVSNIDTINVSNDPGTLAVSGVLSVEVKNQGTATTPIPVEVLAFFDVNKNDRYDNDIDLALGAAVTRSIISTAAVEWVQVDVNGDLPFRDAPIAVWVDSSQGIVEGDEQNNVQVTSSLCQITPPTSGPLDLALKWEWMGSTSYPNRTNVHGPVAVGQMNDDNGDGIIDQYDTPDLVFVAGAGFDPALSILTAINGSDGSELWVTTPLAISHRASVALGDIDGDGLLEIVVSGRDGYYLHAFENNGTQKWTMPSGPGTSSWPTANAISLVDLDADGAVDILHGGYVLNSNGSQKWQLTQDVGDPIFTVGISMLVSIAADVDLDGGMEVVAGRTLYSHSGAVIWHRADLVSDGFNAVGNFDQDDFAEIVLVASGKVYLLEHTGETIWGPISLPGGGRGGPPTIGDYDGDGEPEIGIAGQYFYTVFETDGSIKWSMPTNDPTSNVTGSSLFDFESDGSIEVLYADEQDFRIFDGQTGAELVKIHNTSTTTLEYPNVVDVDNDGYAEIIVTSNAYGADPTFGIRVYEGGSGEWANTRNLWNQHSYHITNINDDGTIPVNEQSSWLTHNTYRLNTFLDRDPLGQADLTASLLKLIDNGAGQSVSLSVRVGNAGAAPSTNNVAVSFYDGDPAIAGILLGSTSLAPLAAGDFMDVQVDGITTLSGTQDVFAVVDADGIVEECNELNNTVSAPVNLSTLGSLVVATDQSLYIPNSPVVVMADVTNTSSLIGSYTIDLSIEDGNGVIVQSFATQSITGLAVGTVTQVQQHWNTGTTLAGNYQVRGLLKSLDGTVLSDATSHFQIDRANVSTPAASLRTTLDRTIYHTSDTVTIQNLATNTTLNTILEDVQLQVTVTDAAAVTLFTETVVLGQMVPGAIRNVTSAYSYQTQPPGAYTVTATLTDAATQILLATNVISYMVQDNLSIAISGVVTVQNTTLNIGEQQLCTSTVSNDGLSDVNGLQLRQVIALLSTQQEYDHFAVTVDLSTGTNQTFTRNIGTSTLSDGVYMCVLQHNIEGTWETLDYKPFTLLNQPPVADAGLDQSGDITNSFTLDGTGSSDANGHSLTYHWTLIQQPAGSVVALANATTVNSILIPDIRGQYVAQLIVNDGIVDSAPDTVLLDVLNIPPVANAGPDQAVAVGETVILNGIASSDAESDPLTYHWTLITAPVGSTTTLNNAATVTPTLVADQKGDYVIELIVNDGYDDSLPATTTITVINTPPVANAGPDQLIHIGDIVTLDGSASTDADGDPISYAWTLVSAPTGSVATLSDATAVMPTLSIDTLGEYVLALVVNDGQVNSVADPVTLNAVNVAPMAKAGPDQSVTVGQAVQLDGSASSDADGDPITYLWSIVDAPVGSVATLSDVTLAMPTLTVDVFGTYTLQLIVNDGIVDSVPDSVTLNVINSLPVANAGPDQAVFVGDNVILDGSASNDADGDPMTYSWSLIEQPANSTAVLVDTTMANPSIVIDEQGIYIAQLIVNDGIVDSTPDTVVLNVANVRPVADAGPDQAVAPLTNVMLNGSGSRDADADPLTYQWSILDLPVGSIPTLADSATMMPILTVDMEGHYILQLIVNDGTINSDPDTTRITVQQDNTAPYCGDAYPSDERIPQDDTLWPPNHSLELINIFGITDPDGDPVSLTITGVTQDEPTNGLGDGDVSPDAFIHGDTVELRSERSGIDNGRVYKIHFTASDHHGANCTGDVRVVVPHSKKDIAIDDGQIYDSTQP